MMFCPKCGNEFPDDAAFCPKCGTEKPAVQAEPAQSGPFEHAPAYQQAQNSIPPAYAPAASEQQSQGAVFAPVSELAVVVQKNTAYYLPQFQRVEAGEKTRFNWAAFFFGAYFCLYRKCGVLAKKYFLIPYLLTFASSLLMTIGLTMLNMTLMAIGGLALSVGSIWSLVSTIRCGRNFNHLYYRHAQAVLAAGNTKKYGTSIGSALLLMVIILAVVIIMSAVSLAMFFSTFGGLYSSTYDGIYNDDSSGYVDDMEPILQEPDTAATDDPVATTDQPAEEDTVGDYSPYVGSFAESANPDDYLTYGGVLVETYLEGDYFYYTIYSHQENYPREAMLEGRAPMDGTSEITFSGEDSWGNTVAGTLYLLSNGNLAVESDVLEADPNAMWDLRIPYTVLVPCYSDNPGNTGDYLFPSDSQYITQADLAPLTRDEVVLVRNEIYARYGYTFSDPDIRAYFEAQSWYHPVEGVNASTFNTAVFNDYERTNLETILAYEREMGWRQ